MSTESFEDWAEEYGLIFDPQTWADCKAAFEAGQNSMSIEGEFHMSNNEYGFVSF